MPKGQILMSLWRLGGQYGFLRNKAVNLALLDQAVVSGVNFITGILLARFLGIDGYGAFTLLWMAVLFLNSFQNALIISPMMSIGCKQDADAAGGYYGAVALQQLLFALVSSLLLMLAVWMSGAVSPDWKIQSYALPLAAASITYQLQEFLRRYFFTRSQPLDALWNDVVSYGSQLLVLLVCFYLAKLDVGITLWIMSATSALAVVVGLFRMGRLSFEKGQWLPVLKRHMAFSGWLAASTLMTWLSGNFLLIAAGAVLGAGAVGILKACQNIIAITHVLFNALGNVVPVRAARLLHSEGVMAMDRYFRKSILLGGLATLILALPAMLIPGLTLKVVYGDELQGYGWLLFGYGFVYLAVFFSQMLTFALRTLEDTRPIFLGYLCTGILNLLLAYPLCKMYGLPGVLSGLLVLSLLNGLILAASFYMKRKKVLQCCAPAALSESISKENTA